MKESKWNKITIPKYRVKYNTVEQWDEFASLYENGDINANM